MRLVVAVCCIAAEATGLERYGFYDAGGYGVYGVPNAGGTGGTWADGRDGSAGARGFSAPRLWVVPPSAQPALRPGAALQGRPSTQPAVRAPLWPAQEAALTTPPGCTFLSRSSYT